MFEADRAGEEGGRVKWYYAIKGRYTYVRVFTNRALCGDLCFRNEEFLELARIHLALPDQSLIEFINETPDPKTP